MFAVGQRAPDQKILRAFRHVRNHLEQHDRFVEVVEVVGGKSGAGIDVGGAQSSARLSSIGIVGRGGGGADGAGLAAVGDDPS